MKRTLSTLSTLAAPLGALVLAGLSTSAHAVVYADALVSQQFTTSFGSGLVTGAPDGGGRFLGDTFDPPANPGNIVVKFTSGLTTGVGADLFVVDVASSANETANVFVSPDNVNFTFVGGLNAVANTLDFGGLYSGVFYYVRLVNSSTLASIDIDAVAGNFAAPVPEPSTYALFGAGALLMAGWKRRSLRQNAK
jgi:PEP-CTERM motif